MKIFDKDAITGGDSTSLDGINTGTEDVSPGDMCFVFESTLKETFVYFARPLGSFVAKGIQVVIPINNDGNIAWELTAHAKKELFSVPAGFCFDVDDGIIPAGFEMHTVKEGDLVDINDGLSWTPNTPSYNSYVFFLNDFLYYFTPGTTITCGKYDLTNKIHTPLTSHSGSSVYDVNGMSVYNGEVFFFKWLLKYTIGTDTWATIATPPSSCGSLRQAVTIGDKIYILGNNGSGYHSMTEYDPSLDIYTAKLDTPWAYSSYTKIGTDGTLAYLFSYTVGTPTITYDPSSNTYDETLTAQIPFQHNCYNVIYNSVDGVFVLPYAYSYYFMCFGYDPVLDVFIGLPYVVNYYTPYLAYDSSSNTFYSLYCYSGDQSLYRIRRPIKIQVRKSDA